MNVPEGVNGIQVGAFINIQELKTLVLPSTFSFINYNLNLNDYKNIYVGINQIILIMNAIYIQLNLQKMTLPLMLE